MVFRIKRAMKNLFVLCMCGRNKCSCDCNLIVGDVSIEFLNG